MSYCHSKITFRRAINVFGPVLYTVSYFHRTQLIHFQLSPMILPTHNCTVTKRETSEYTAKLCRSWSLTLLYFTYVDVVKIYKLYLTFLYLNI